VLRSVAIKCGSAFLTDDQLAVHFVLKRREGIAASASVGCSALPHHAILYAKLRFASVRSERQAPAGGPQLLSQIMPPGGPAVSG
jgi:hypothetical protein